MNTEIMKIEQESTEISQKVQALVVKDQASYESGALMKISLSTFRKKLNLFFDPMVSKAKAAYDEVRGTRDKYLKPTKELEDIVKDKLKSYERAKEKEAEDARRKAEEEKQKKIDAENEKRKQEAELFNEKAEEVNPDEIETEQPLPTIDRVKGLGIRKLWKWKVVDESKIPREYFVLDAMLINKEVRGLKDKLEIPGIEVYED